MQPGAYDVKCDLCEGPVEWSEFEHMVWCPKCEKDTPGTDGIFDGPIPYEVTKMLGISFDRIDLKTGVIYEGKRWQNPMGGISR